MLNVLRLAGLLHDHHYRPQGRNIVIRATTPITLQRLVQGLTNNGIQNRRYTKIADNPKGDLYTGHHPAQHLNEKGGGGSIQWILVI